MVEALEAGQPPLEAAYDEAFGSFDKAQREAAELEEVKRKAELADHLKQENERKDVLVGELVQQGEDMHVALIDVLQAYASIQEHYGLKPESSSIYTAARTTNKRWVALLAKARSEVSHA